MSVSPYDEVVRAVEWLEGSIGFPCERSVAHSISAKFSTSLLPVGRVLGYRRRLAAFRVVKGMEPFFWPAFRGVLKVLLIRRNWPETMEIDFGGCAKKGQPLQGEKNTSHGVCIAVSMQSYSSTAAHLARGLTSHGSRVEMLTPGSAASWTSLKTLPDGCKPLPLECFVTDGMKSMYERDRRTAEGNWEETAPKIRRGGPPVLKDMLSIAPSQLKYVATEVIPQAHLYKEVARAALRALRPQSLFVMRLKRITESVLAEAAKELGITVFLVNHGHIGRTWDPLSLGRVDCHCDSVLSWNKDQAETWVHLFPMLDRARVHTVGGIQWDEPILRFSARGHTGKAEVRQRIHSCLGIDETRESDEKWITITVDPHVRRFLHEVVQVLDQMKGIRVVIKTRPHEPADEYRDFAKGRSITIVSKESNIDLFELLYASDLVMTCESTTNLDALSVGTPVMTLMMDRRSRLPERYVYLERFGLPIVSSKGELSRVIGHWATSPEKQQEWREAAAFAARSLLSNYPSGDAGEKIAHLMRDSLANGAR